MDKYNDEILKDKKSNNEISEIIENIQKREDDIMPAIELVEKERIDYLNDMRKYIDDLRKLPHEQLVKESKKNLMASGIINENCELTDTYAYSKNNKRK